MAATNLKCLCKNHNGEFLEGDGLNLGSFLLDSVDYCDPIAGLQTRVQTDQGSAGDDTSLNDVKFVCMEP
jgi:hypothetical protein